MNPAPPLLHIAERRAETRIEVELPARIIAADGREHRATIRNISTGGVLVHLDAAHAVALLPNVRRELRHLPVGVRLEFTLPVAGTEAAVTVDCGIAHLRRIAGGAAAMGLGFRRFHAGAEHALARFWAI